MIFLSPPSIAYKDSYLQGLREFQGEGKYLNYHLKRIEEHFEDFLRQLAEQQERDKVTPGRVPNADFWLIDGQEFIGRLSLRYELNEYLLRIGGTIGYEIRPSKRRQGYGKELLRLGLLEAQNAGLQRVLVTCDEDNLGSKRIIEANGGVFENAVEVEGTTKKKLRYWIGLDLPVMLEHLTNT